MSRNVSPIFSFSYMSNLFVVHTHPFAVNVRPSLFLIIDTIGNSEEKVVRNISSQ